MTTGKIRLNGEDRTVVYSLGLRVLTAFSTNDPIIYTNDNGLAVTSHPTYFDNGISIVYKARLNERTLLDYPKREILKFSPPKADYQIIVLIEDSSGQSTVKKVSGNRVLESIPTRDLDTIIGIVSKFLPETKEEEEG